MIVSFYNVVVLKRGVVVRCVAIIVVAIEITATIRRFIVYYDLLASCRLRSMA